MSSFLWHTIADTGANLLAITDHDMSDLFKTRGYWNYQARNPRCNKEQYGFVSLWPRSRMSMGDPSQDLILGVDMSEGGRYEPLDIIEGGSQRGYFIHGVCVDGAGAPLAACTLDLFITATDVWVASGSTDSNGIYSLPTPNLGVNHYIVANYGPNTLVGASVNTLQPVTSPW